MAPAALQPLTNTDPTTLMTSLLVSLRPSLPYLHRSHKLRSDSTAIVTPMLISLRPVLHKLRRNLRLGPETTSFVVSLLVSLHPLCIELLDRTGYGLIFRPSWLHCIAAFGLYGPSYTAAFG